MTVEQRNYLNRVIEKIDVERHFSEAELRIRAIEHYKYLWKDTAFMLESVQNASNEQVQQWMVNYVRHELTGYDDALLDVSRNVPAGYQLLKNAVLCKIADAYPFLRNECEKQVDNIYLRKW